jgi:uncharacterized membrane protein
MSTVIEGSRQARSMLPRLGWGLMLLGAVFAAGNAVLFMFADAYGHPGIKERFLATAIAGWVHTMAGALAALIGPFQLLPRWRATQPRVHVWMGRVYLCAVGASALAGFFFAQSSVGGWVSRVGFTLLAIFWLASGATAFVCIRRRDVASHRRWMIRNYALTFAAVTLRLELPAMQLSGIPFSTAFGIVAWLCWIPNWLVVEFWLRRSRS